MRCSRPPLRHRQSVDLIRDPISLGWSVASNSTTVTRSLDVTMDDPFGNNPNPTLNPATGGRSVSVLGSSAFGGPGTVASSLDYGVITGPIAAWRLTVNGTAKVTATVVQPGPR
jgi:hypothetical protein